MPSSERLFSTLSYALFAAPAAVVVIWLVWRVMVWCLFYTAVVAAWIGSLPAFFRIPIALGLSLVAWPLLVLAFSGWIVTRLFPGLAVESGEVPRLFARSTSTAFSYVFIFFLVLPVISVPLKYLAYRLGGPQISTWHWLLVFGPIPILVVCLAILIRRKQAENRL